MNEDPAPKPQPAKRKIQLEPLNDFGAELETELANEFPQESTPFGETIEENVPEEILVQQPGRVELDLQNAFGDMDGGFEEDAANLELEAQQEYLTQQPAETNPSIEEAAEVPMLTNDTPVRLQLKADNGLLSKGASGFETEVNQLIPFLKQPMWNRHSGWILNPQKRVLVQTTLQTEKETSEPGLFKLTPDEPAPLMRTCSTRQQLRCQKVLRKESQRPGCRSAERYPGCQQT
ncbi:MAG: hypothetical protein R3C11_16465 [Planctomycetaceae bacterium]